MVRSGPSPLFMVKPGREIPDAVEARSCGWMALDFSDRGASSNSFDCGGYGDLGKGEENNDGLRTSAMMMKDEEEDDDKDGGDFADYLSDTCRALRPAASRIRRGLGLPGRLMDHDLNYCLSARSRSGSNSH